MDETKRRILEEAGFSKEFIEEMAEGDLQIARAGITDEMIENIVRKVEIGKPKMNKIQKIIWGIRHPLQFIRNFFGR